MLLLPATTEIIQEKGFLGKSLYIILGIAAVAIFAGAFILGRTTAPQNNSASETTKAPAILAEKSINKTFSFPVVNSQGAKVTDVTYTIISVDKQNEIIINGQRAFAVAGRTFFIINIKITNNSNQTVQLQSRDYIRISSDKNTELQAADIHNDPIVIQPISTENTRLGFPIDANAKSFTLHVGELNGQKTDLPVTFTQ